MPTYKDTAGTEFVLKFKDSKTLSITVEPSIVTGLTDPIKGFNRLQNCHIYPTFEPNTDV